MQDLIAVLVAFFLPEPRHAEIAAMPGAAGAPRAVVAEVTSGASTAVPHAGRAPGPRQG